MKNIYVVRFRVSGKNTFFRRKPEQIYDLSKDE